MQKKYKILFIVAVLLAFGLGFVFGVEAGVKECISYGVKIAHNFINVTFDNDKLANLLYTYRGKIQMTGGLT